MAENKMATFEQLKLLALRGKADFTARIGELAELVLSGFEELQHTGVTITLPAANWNGRAQTIKHSSLLANGSYRYLVCPDADCFAESGEAGVKADNITVDGEVTFRCEVPPESDLTVHILRLEVETE